MTLKNIENMIKQMYSLIYFDNKDILVDKHDIKKTEVRNYVSIKDISKSIVLKNDKLVEFRKSEQKLKYKQPKMSGYIIEDLDSFEIKDIEITKTGDMIILSLCFNNGEIYVDDITDFYYILVENYDYNIPLNLSEFYLYYSNRDLYEFFMERKTMKVKYLHSVVNNFTNNQKSLYKLQTKLNMSLKNKVKSITVKKDLPYIISKDNKKMCNLVSVICKFEDKNIEDAVIEMDFFPDSYIKNEKTLHKIVTNISSNILSKEILGSKDDLESTILNINNNLPSNVGIKLSICGENEEGKIVVERVKGFDILNVVVKEENIEGISDVLKTSVLPKLHILDKIGSCLHCPVLFSLLNNVLFDKEYTKHMEKLMLEINKVHLRQDILILENIYVNYKDYLDKILFGKNGTDCGENTEIDFDNEVGSICFYDEIEKDNEFYLVYKVEDNLTGEILFIEKLIK